ncbi:MAG: ATP-dependent DNA ligase, partial [Ilumatobacteraceae bacterium]
MLAKRLTRRDLVRHLTSVAPAMLPYLRDRAVELHRFPRGVEAPGSWQRTVPSSAPAWLGRAEVRLVVDSPAALAWAAGRSTFELCASTATTSAPERPSWAIVRIDPAADGSLDDALIPARLLRTALEHLGLDGRPVLVGSAIEVRVPIAARWTHERVRAWVDQLVGAIAATVPEAPAPRALDASSFVAP